MNADQVYGLFDVLDGLVKKWKKDGKIGQTWKNALVGKGLAYKPDISQTAKSKKFVEEYSYTYNGTKHVFGEHVTLGVGQDPQKCLSVHWLRDEKKKCIVVARCGKHPSNTKT